MIYTKNRNEVRVLPIKNWIIFHKNVKYTDEDEYNVKVKKAEEDFLRLQKGKKGRKILMKKQEEEEEEKEKLAIDKNNDSGSEKKNSGVILKNLVF